MSKPCAFSPNNVCTRPHCETGPHVCLIKGTTDILVTIGQTMKELNFFLPQKLNQIEEKLKEIQEKM